MDSKIKHLDRQWTLYFIFCCMRNKILMKALIVTKNTPGKTLTDNSGHKYLIFLNKKYEETLLELTGKPYLRMRNIKNIFCNHKRELKNYLILIGPYSIEDKLVPRHTLIIYLSIKRKHF